MTSNQDLAGQLKRLYQENDDYLRREFDRSLPFADGLFDRWERAKRLGFGEESCIYNSAMVMGDVMVGRHTWVGPYVFLDGGYDKVLIGEYCSISAGVHIYSHDTVMWSLSGGTADKKTGPVTIEDCCYLGSQSIIAPNVTIGRQTVVATNSFVNRDVPARTIVGGCPAKPIGRVEGDGEDLRLVYNSGEEK